MNRGILDYHIPRERFLAPKQFYMDNLIRPWTFNLACLAKTEEDPRHPRELKGVMERAARWRAREADPINETADVEERKSP